MNTTPTTTDGIRLTRIEAVNVLKFDRFELDNPGKLTLFRGANDRGKTTALRLLGLCVRGAEGDSARVIHDGASKGLVSLGLSNGYTLRRTFTERGEYFDLLDEKGHKVPGPQTYINKWLGEYRDFNPLAWLQMEPKEQIRILLQAVAANITAEEFRAATGLEPPPGIDFSRHGLIVLDELRAHYADERRIGNRLAEQKRAAAAEARAALPAERPVITEARADAVLQAQSDAREARRSIEIRRATASSHEFAVRRIEQDKERERDEQSRITSEIERLRAEITSLEAKHAASVARISELDCELDGLASSAPPSQDEIDAANRLIRDAIALASALEEDRKILERFAAVEQMEQEATNAAAQVSILEATTIKIIDGELRQALMKKVALPVDSLTIEGGSILVGGHELQYLAESQRMRIAVAIARALRPTLRVIVLDGAEQLDAETFALFIEEIRGDGFTYLATEVDRNGGALEIIQFGEDLEVVSQKAVA